MPHREPPLFGLESAGYRLIVNGGQHQVEWTEFFFGAELTEKIRANGWARLPEWVGMWVTARR